MSHRRGRTACLSSCCVDLLGQRLEAEAALREDRHHVHDLADGQVVVCGVANRFEAVFTVQVRDSKGTELKQVSITTGGIWIWASFPSILSIGIVSMT